MHSGGRGDLPLYRPAAANLRVAAGPRCIAFLSLNRRASRWAFLMPARDRGSTRLTLVWCLPASGERVLGPAPGRRSLAVQTSTGTRTN